MERAAGESADAAVSRVAEADRYRAAREGAKAESVEERKVAQRESRGAVGAAKMAAAAAPAAEGREKDEEKREGAGLTKVHVTVSQPAPFAADRKVALAAKGGEAAPAEDNALAAAPAPVVGKGGGAAPAGPAAEVTITLYPGEGQEAVQTAQAETEQVQQPTLVAKELAPRQPVAAKRAEPAPDQILTVEADQPARLAAKAIALARRSGVQPLSQVAEAPAGGTEAAEIRLAFQVPGEKYEAFLAQVSQISAPQQQRLANSVAAAESVFLQRVQVAYEQRRVAEAQRQADALKGQADMAVMEDVAVAKAAGAPGAGAGGAGFAAKAGPAAPSNGKARNEEKAKADELEGDKKAQAPREVNLVIRLVRHGVAAGEGTRAPAAAIGQQQPGEAK
jgi:hypothetical protein